MIECLEDVDGQIKKQGGKLHTFYGNNNSIIRECIKILQIDYVVFNMDYTPYAIERDDAIVDLCEKMGVDVEMTHDYYLNPPGTILNGSGNSYQKFTPYYNVASKMHIDSPSSARKIKFASFTGNLPNRISLNDAFSKFTKENVDILVNGGRPFAIKCLKIALKIYILGRLGLSHRHGQVKIIYC